MHIGRGEVFIIIVVFILILAVAYTVQALYLVTANKVLKAVRPEFRQTEPGQVWLGFIPVFHLIWPLIINPKITASVKADLEDRGFSEPGDYGKLIGTLYPALRFGGYIPVIGSLFSLAYLVLFILWWVKLGSFKKNLENELNIQSRSAELLDS